MKGLIKKLLREGLVTENYNFENDGQGEKPSNIEVANAISLRVLLPCIIIGITILLVY